MGARKSGKNYYPFRKDEEELGLRKTSTLNDPNLERYKGDLKELIIQQDLADHNRRFRWMGIPAEIDEDFFEMLLYYRRQVILFYSDVAERFYILPFTMSGSGTEFGLDILGRFNMAKPIAITAQYDNSGSLIYKEEAFISSDYYLKVQKSVMPQDEFDKLTPDDLKDRCVIFRDTDAPYFSGQTDRSRYDRIQSLADIMVEQLLYARSSGQLSVGSVGVEVADGETAGQVLNANAQLRQAAMNGDKYIPINNTFNSKNLQALDVNSKMLPENFFQSYTSFDALRLETLGIGDGMMFKRQGTTLQSEVDSNAINTRGKLLQDLRIRQEACLIANQLFSDKGLLMWCMTEDELSAINGPQDVSGRDEYVDETEQVLNGSNVQPAAVPSSSSSTGGDAQ